MSHEEITEKYYAKVTLKSWAGGYNTRTYKFKSEKHFDNWCDKHNKDHTLGKIIGIHEKGEIKEDSDN